MAEKASSGTMDRNLALEAVRVTEAAALAASKLMGRGDEKAADQAAVDAMRRALNGLPIDGTIVIGEGEKDDAPMLFNGESVGNGRGPKCDVAVDPIDGTSLTAEGRNNALSVLAVSDHGTMLDASSVFYMDKLVTGPAGVGVVDIRLPIAENIRLLAQALGKPVDEIVVSVLNRPRHDKLIEEIREAGAGTRLMSDGDVAGGINAARHNARTDMCVGIGGSPRGSSRPARSRLLAVTSRAGSGLAMTTRRSVLSMRASRSTDISTRPTTWFGATTRSSLRPA